MATASSGRRAVPARPWAARGISTSRLVTLSSRIGRHRSGQAAAGPAVLGLSTERSPVPGPMWRPHPIRTVDLRHEKEGARRMPNRALITGASRGLGLALARALAADGWELVIDARGEHDLRSAAADLGPDAAVHAVPGDVGDEAHRLDLAAAVDAPGGGLDL